MYLVADYETLEKDLGHHPYCRGVLVAGLLNHAIAFGFKGKTPGTGPTIVISYRGAKD